MGHMVALPNGLLPKFFAVRLKNKTGIEFVEKKNFKNSDAKNVPFELL